MVLLFFSITCLRGTNMAKDDYGVVVFERL